MSDKEIKGEKIDLNIKIVAVIIIAIVSYVAWFYNTVVIPLGQLQVSNIQEQSTLSQIQATLQSNSQNENSLDKRVTFLENKLGINEKQ